MTSRVAPARFGLAILLAGTLLTTGCAAGGDASPSPSGDQVASKSPPQARLKPAPVDEGRPAAEDQDAAPSKQKLTAAAPLVGHDAPEIRRTLGAPDSVVANTPGEIWRYRRGDCALDLFFYPSVNGGPLQVVTAEAAGPDAETPLCVWKDTP